MEKREERRDRTWRAARRAQRRHLRVVHRDGEVDCSCEFSVWMFAKWKAQCDCRKKRPGRPKIARGICYRGNPAAEARRAWQIERYRWLRWRCDGDDAVSRE